MSEYTAEKHYMHTTHDLILDMSNVFGEEHHELVGVLVQLRLAAYPYLDHFITEARAIAEEVFGPEAWNTFGTVQTRGPETTALPEDLITDFWETQVDLVPGGPGLSARVVFSIPVDLDQPTDEALEALVGKFPELVVRGSTVLLEHILSRGLWNGVSEETIKEAIHELKEALAQ